MKRLHFSLLVLICIGFTQCQKPGCVEHSGSITSLKRTIQPFTRIILQDNINLFITQEEEDALVVEAKENIQPNISTVVENGVLTIANNGTCEWLTIPDKEINVYVSSKNLEQLNYEGSGTVTSMNMIQVDHFGLYSKKGAGNISLHLNADHTTIHLEGENPDITLLGISDHCNISVDPRSSINLSDFEVRLMTIEYMGIRNAVINVTEQLTANLYHTGNLFYKGSPSIITPVYYSSGRLIKAL